MEHQWVEVPLEASSSAFFVTEDGGRLCVLADDDAEEGVSEEEFDTITDEELEARAQASTVFVRFALGFEERAPKLGG